MIYEKAINDTRGANASIDIISLREIFNLPVRVINTHNIRIFNL